MERLATTPFGAAPMRARTFLHQAETERRQKALADAPGGNDQGTADKWQLLRALTEARAAFGLSDRTLSLLEALASFHPERVLDGRAPLIVFPSNTELSLRTRGMSPATLRRHLALLVEAGLILRRDSPNGKRYCRRDGQGRPEDAFGFDLAPLALAAGSIHEKAEAARHVARSIARARAEVTLHLRDISKLIETAIGEHRPGPWLTLATTLATLSGRLARNATLDSLQTRLAGLRALRTETEEAWLSSLSEQEMSANDIDSERHIQNSNTEQTFESSSQEKVKEGKAAENRRRAPDIKAFGLTLERLTTLCPHLGDYAKAGLKSWRDVQETADMVRSMLGISPDAWEKAKAAMGPAAAAVVIAAMLERAEDIRSPGGYLRDLTRKAETGRFSLGPMLKALEGRG